MKSLLSILALTVLTSTAFARVEVVESETKNVTIKKYYEGEVRGVSFDVLLNKGRLTVSCNNPSEEVTNSIGDISRIDGASNTHLYGYIVSASKLQMTYSISGDNSEVIKNFQVPLNSDCGVSEQ